MNLVCLIQSSWALIQKTLAQDSLGDSFYVAKQEYTWKGSRNEGNKKLQVTQLIPLKVTFMMHE